MFIIFYLSDPFVIQQCSANTVSSPALTLECNQMSKPATINCASRKDCATVNGSKLSILEYKDQIVQLVQDHRVVCLEGEAGCGKSTMVPQFILDSFISENPRILVSQPRRVSAIKLAQHVACLRQEKCGKTVGYCIGGSISLSSNTQITYCTTGYLLQVKCCC